MSRVLADVNPAILRMVEATGLYAGGANATLEALRITAACRQAEALERIADLLTQQKAGR